MERRRATSIAVELSKTEGYKASAAASERVWNAFGWHSRGR